ncbi:MAG TPA: prolyl oligopeptidase family serine peptidase [Bacteroidota bacterium]|nr:prolyl oligopeptidase family serine peptidase [Bacteroidota bacterium]
MLNSTNSRLWLFVALLICATGHISAQPAPKDETRYAWGTATGGFIQDWLVLAGFPNQDGKGYEIDFLQERGGESAIKPEVGMVHTLANGTTLAWKNYHSPYPYVNIFDVMKSGDFNNKVMYAFVNVKRENAGKVILSFGHNVSNKLWVNGKSVYESKTDYQAAQEDNHIEVDMEKGDNSILIKSVHGGWTWGFIFRVVEPEQFSLINDFKLTPKIEPTSAPNRLVVNTDRTRNPEIQKFDVAVKAVVAGGRVVAEKHGKRGDQITFDTKSWPEGVYDICLQSTDTHGEIATAYLYWYKGDVIKKAQELISTAPKHPATPNDYLHVMLSEMLIHRFKIDPKKIDSSSFQNLYSPLMEYEEALLDNAGKKGSVRANGFTRLTYIDEVDHTPQFCRAFLPMQYTPKQKWALVVMLHGYNGANPIYVNWWSIDQRHNSVVDKYPIIYIEPHGRGNTSYRGIGDQDILRCIELAKQRFNIDENRIYLKGESMGGGGVWNVGTRHPELFAAIAPVYGGWDYHVGMNEQEIAKLSGRALFQNEAASNLSHADALLTTPVFVIHGDIDRSVDVSNSRYLVKTLQRWGYDIRYHEYPGFGHEGIEYYDELIPWFLEHTRNADPKKVRVRSADLQYASAHWVKVTQRGNPYAFIQAEAEVLANNTIRLSTENVSGIDLTPSKKLIDPRKPVTVIWNVSDRRDVKVNNGKIQLLAKEYHPAALNKTPMMEGTIGGLTTTPFAVVIGTISPDSMMVKLCAQKAGNFINEWKTWQKYEPRVFKDTEISGADVKKYSLILYGGADANKVTRSLSGKIPLKISSDAIEIGGRNFPVKDACVQMVYPHPLNPERYVQVIGATSGAGMFFGNRAPGELDFVIQDGCLPNNHLGRPQEKVFAARGMFDNAWQINEALLETGVPELRNACAFRKVLPNLTTTVENVPKIDTAVYHALAGVYEIMPGMVVGVSVDAERLMVKSPDGMTFRLYPVSETEYFVDGEDIQLSFAKNENGVFDKGVVYQGTREIPMKKVASK